MMAQVRYVALAGDGGTRDAPKTWYFEDILLSPRQERFRPLQHESTKANAYTYTYM